MATALEPTTRGTPGRPRNDALDGQILHVVRELLAERGYQDLSVQEVIRRCGVHARTVTRRWPTKAELVLAAIFEDDMPADEDAPAPTGDLRADLREIVASSLHFLCEPATWAAIPALMSEMRTNAQVTVRIRERQRGLSEHIESLLGTAVRSGDAPARVLESSALVPNLLTGVVFSVHTMETVTLDDALIDELTDLIVAAILGFRADATS
jgi:AcrR family transcriptional regulator